MLIPQLELDAYEIGESARERAHNETMSKESCIKGDRIHILRIQQSKVLITSATTVSAS